MRLHRSLDDIFSSRSHVRILRAVLELPQGFAVSAREAARRAGVSHPRASSVLHSIAEQGLIKIHSVPRADLFTVNPDHIMVPVLSQFFTRERQIPQDLVIILRKYLRRNLPFVSAAYLFGSAIRGNTTAASDIDLALLCPPSKVLRAEQATAALAELIQDRFGNRLSVVIGGSSPAKRGLPGPSGSRLWGRIIREGVSILSRVEQSR